jgi:hypothetical protein
MCPLCTAGVFEELGDEVVREHVFSTGEVLRIEERAQHLIAARAKGLGKRPPRLRQMLAGQRRAVTMLG